MKKKKLKFKQGQLFIGGLTHASGENCRVQVNLEGETSMVSRKRIEKRWATLNLQLRLDEMLPSFDTCG